MPTKYHLSNRILLTSSFIIFLFLSIYITPNFSGGNIETLLSCATFIYGTFTAFTVSNSINRHSKIKETLKQTDASLLSVFMLSQVFSKEVQEKIRSLIDDHLIAQIDYFLYDFKYSYPSFLELSNFILNLKSRNKQEELSQDKVIDIVVEIGNQRKAVESIVREVISLAEWSVIITLQITILFCLLLMNDGEIISIVTNTLLATTSVFILIIIRNFNNLSWKEEYWAWQSLEELFLQFNLLPYFPKEVLENGRARPKIGRKIRVAYYPNPYPNMTGKKIKVEVVKTGRK